MKCQYYLRIIYIIFIFVLFILLYYLFIYVSCPKFGQLIIRKIIRIVATRCQIFSVKMYKIQFRLGLRPRSHLGAYSAPSLVELTAT